MNKLLTLIFISTSAACFGQRTLTTANAKAVDYSSLSSGKIDEVKKSASQSNEKIILFSKGEAFTEKEWQEYRKQIYPIVREFFKRDSTHNKFLSNTVIPNLIPGDSIESYNITLEGIFLKLKPKKK